MHDSSHSRFGQPDTGNQALAHFADQLSPFVSKLIEVRNRELQVLGELSSLLQRMGLGAGQYPEASLPVRSYEYRAGDAPAPSRQPEQTRAAAMDAADNRRSNSQVTAERVVQIYEEYCAAYTERPSSIKALEVFADFVRRRILNAAVMEVFRDLNGRPPYELHKDSADVSIVQKYWMVEAEGKTFVLPVPNSPDEFNDLEIFDKQAGGPFAPRDYLAIVPPQLELLPSGVWHVNENGKIGRASGPRPAATQVDAGPGSAGTDQYSVRHREGGSRALPGQSDSSAVGYDRKFNESATEQQGSNGAQRRAFYDDVGRAYVSFCKSAGSASLQEQCDILSRRIREFGHNIRSEFTDDKKGFIFTDTQNNVAYCPAPNPDGSFDGGWEGYITGSSSVTVKTLRRFVPYDGSRNSGLMSAADGMQAGKNGLGGHVPSGVGAASSSESVEEVIISLFSQIMASGETAANPETFKMALRVRFPGIPIDVKVMKKSPQAGLYFESLKPGLAGSAEEAWLVVINGQQDAWLVPVFKKNEPVIVDAFEVSPFVNGEDRFRIKPAQMMAFQSDSRVQANSYWKVKAKGVVVSSEVKTGGFRKFVDKVTKNV